LIRGANRLRIGRRLRALAEKRLYDAIEPDLGRAAMNFLRPYFAVLSARYRMLLQYRAAALAGFATQLFWGAIKVMILAAFFAASSGNHPMTLAQVVTYIWLGQALLGLLPWNVDAELQEKMLSGAVAYELLRPLDLYAYWYAQTLALRTATTSLRMLPMFVTVGLGLPLLGLSQWALPPPAGVASAAAFGVSMLMTILLASSITMLLHIALIWTLSGRGFNSIMTGLVIVLSGNIVPLPLFPDWLQGFLHWQPFRGLADVPYRIYSGNIAFADAGFEIFTQLLWTVVIVAAGSAVLRRASRRIVVQGG
jgi:viologen exporter family transport system permease protein